jgi:hypothetical protein
MTPMAKTEHEKRCAELEGIIAQAITALEDGERGTCLRLLKTGKAKPPISSTGVIAGSAA